MNSYPEGTKKQGMRGGFYNIKISMQENGIFSATVTLRGGSVLWTAEGSTPGSALGQVSARLDEDFWDSDAQHAADNVVEV